MSKILFTHNFIFLLGGIINICLAFFILFYGRKKMTSTMMTFFALCLAVAVFQISHVLGTNASDAQTSKFIFMFNLTNIFIGIFLTHWFLSLIGKVREHRAMLILIYTSGLSLMLFFMAFPLLFLIDSVPKMYLPFYYEPGKFYFVMVLWFFLTSVYYFYILMKAYLTERDPVQKNRFKYVLTSILYAYIVGTTAFLLVFDIQFNPFLAAFFGFYTIPLAYAMIKYELLDIRILAKRTFIYGIIMVLFGLVIIATNFVGNYLPEIIPSFPQWLPSFIIAILSVIGGIYLWRKGREADLAKYEFIAVIMHKFRTPLTEVKWAAELINDERQVLSSKGREALDMVQQAYSKIIELTNVLISLSDTDQRSYVYNFKMFDFLTVQEPLLVEYRARFIQKNISLTIDSQKGNGVQVYSDPDKIKFAVEILLNNAFQYTPVGGNVKISLSQLGKNAIWTISDTGIGISRESSALIFSKFYRGENAKKMSTEGIGLGLYLAHEIVRRAGGTLAFFSGGINAGTAFTMTLPTKI